MKTKNLPAVISKPKPRKASPAAQPTVPAVADPITPAGMADLTPAEQAELQALLAPLSPRRQAFVRHFITTSNASEAARRSGYAVGNVKATAWRISSHPSVKKALEGFRQLIARRAVYSFEQASADFADAAAFAKATNNATALARSLELRAKHHGFLSDKLDVRHQGDVAIFLPDRMGGDNG
ncbi:MAG: terminase small subunit [Mesorhizobium sp.]